MERLPDDVTRLVFEEIVDQRVDLMTARLVCHEWEEACQTAVEDSQMEELCEYLRAMRICTSSIVPKQWVFRYAGSHRYIRQPLAEDLALTTFSFNKCFLFWKDPELSLFRHGRDPDTRIEYNCYKRQTKMRICNVVIGPSIAVVALVVLRHILR